MFMPSTWIVQTTEDELGIVDCPSNNELPLSVTIHQASALVFCALIADRMAFMGGFMNSLFH